MRSFLGLVSFYKMFIPQVSDLMGALSDLLRENAADPLSWNEDLLDCLQHLKTDLFSPPIIRLPNPKLTFDVRSDVSLHSVGAVLLQYYLECPHPISYASQKLLDCKKRYSTMKRDCLAVIFIIQRFDIYLRGKKFVLEIDHKPLLYLTTFKGKNDRLLRWDLAPQAYCPHSWRK